MDKLSKKKVLFIFPMALNQRNKLLNYYRVVYPLVVAIAKRLTPDNVSFEFTDDRLEKINYNTDADLIAISVKTHTATRAYEIAKKFKELNKKVLLGGIHVSLIPDEAKEYADCIAIGEVENLWPKIMQDLNNNSLKKVYQATERADLQNIVPDRSIFKNKKYFPVNLVETSRGCNHNCKFCAVSTIYNHTCSLRPIEDIVNEIKQLPKYVHILFTDDNICADIVRTKELLKALIPLKINWSSQISSIALQDEELVSLMAKSGCKAVLIGFESFETEKLKSINKTWNHGIEHYQKVVDTCNKYNLLIFGTFIFGFDTDTEETFKRVFDFAQKNCFFYAGFHNLTPFPGTELYNEMLNDLVDKKYWLNKPELLYSKGFVYNPKCMSALELQNLCLKYEKKYFSIKYMLLRAIHLKGSILNKFLMLFAHIHKFIFSV